MPEHFINLNCANCGAKLDVYDDIEVFACGYCGTQLLVQRRGGTVALKTVTEAIKKVQLGTDKTAAELALARLSQESVRLDEDLKRLTSEANGIKSSSTDSKGCSLLFGGIGVFVGFVFLMDSLQSYGSGSGTFAFLSLLMLGGSFTWIFRAWTASTSSKLVPLEKQILEKQREMAEVNSRIAEQRRIVDSAQ